MTRSIPTPHSATHSPTPHTSAAPASTRAEDDALRSLDVARPALTEAERSRARSTLEAIVATPPPPLAGTVVAAGGGARGPAAGPGRTSAEPRRRPARTVRRLVLVPAAALALAAAIVVLPGLGGDETAYASWTPTPVAVDGAELEAVAKACTRQLRGGSIDMDRAELVLAERRGEVVALLYRTDDPDMSGSCLARNVPGTTRVTDVSSGVGGSSGPALLAPAGSFTEGAIAQFRGVSITDGAVGPDVVAVTIHAGEVTVEASVANGRFVAWWPGAAFESGPLAPSGEGGPEPILTYDLTLADGTVVRDAQPTRPS